MVKTAPLADIARPKYIIPQNAHSGAMSFYSNAYLRHWDLLSAITPDARDAKPLMFITILPEVDYTESSSSRNRLAESRYQEIDKDLEAIRQGEMTDESFEAGAVDTARALVAQIRSKQIAPPELNWLGTEAIVMLWVIGSQKLALTITDGEVGYTLRENGKTLQRRSNIQPGNFDLLRLR